MHIPNLNIRESKDLAFYSTLGALIKVWVIFCWLLFIPVVFILTNQKIGFSKTFMKKEIILIC